jgi:hypothetical protein
LSKKERRLRIKLNSKEEIEIRGKESGEIRLESSHTTLQSLSIRNGRTSLKLKWKLLP